MAATPASRARLRKVDCTTVPGLRRARRGKGFTYLDPDGDRVADTEILARIRELAIPPAWEDVWICPYPGGHIQATGIDQRGRKQYLYHSEWRARQDARKFDDMVAFARTLPALRTRVEQDLQRGDFSQDHVLALAVRLLDRGFFRIGSEDYAVTNETYGLATMRKRHVRVRDGVLHFDYPAKHSKRRVQQVVDPAVSDDICTLKKRRGGGDELLAYKSRNGRWTDVRSTDINMYLKYVTGEDVSAKDFRTWGATVLAAVGLAVSPVPDTRTARKRAVTRVVKEVAYYLGNTPAVARGSYSTRARWSATPTAPRSPARCTCSPTPTRATPPRSRATSRSPSWSSSPARTPTRSPRPAASCSPPPDPRPCRTACGNRYQSVPTTVSLPRVDVGRASGACRSRKANTEES
jgi:DNA topoisomerase I